MSQSTKKTKCNVILGSTTKPTPQYGIFGKATELGENGNRIVGIDLNQTQTMLMFGRQGAGKSYCLGTIIEMYSNKIEGINEMVMPGCSVIFHYSSSRDYKPEWVSMLHPNSNQKELDILHKNYKNVKPIGATKMVLLSPPSLLEERRKEFPDVQVEPLLFHSSEINVESWMNLMGGNDNESLEMLALFDLMETNRNNLTPAVLIDAIMKNEDLSDEQKKALRLRIRRAEKYICEDHYLAKWVEPGTTIIVDMRDEFLFKGTAFRLMLCALQVIQNVTMPDGTKFPKLVCFDEAHEYADDEFLIQSFLRMVRLMRHKALTIMLASQDPMSIDARIIELSSLIIMLAMETPAWVEHIANAKAQVKNLVAEELTELPAGGCFVWSRLSSDSHFTKAPQKLQIRPRVTMHGGATKTAESQAQESEAKKST